MRISSVLAALLVCWCICDQIDAFSRIEMEDVDDEEFDGPKPVEKFKVHISERGSLFNEKIYILENKDIEYFKVPPHNGLSETDNLYDFKMNITVTRVKKDRVCQISPLPSDLPRPNVLSKGLKSLSHSPPSHNIEKDILQYKVGPKVDKKTLRKEVRDFCGQFPVYRLVPFSLDSVSMGEKKTEKRDMSFPLCKNMKPPQCHPDSWLYRCKISTARCVYYVKCKLNSQQKNLGACSSVVKHRYDSQVCCTPRCP